jgi:phosphoribosylformylglycinamidine synthase subunit PurQ / glutaminase
MSRINALVFTGYGLNCDMETAHAFELAGAVAERVHINALIDGSVILDRDYQIMSFIGGFSWGDDHGAGVVQAVRMRTRIGDKLTRFVEKGKLVIGICNGFQCLVNLGLLPGLDGDYTRRSVAMTYNDCGNFRDDWVHLAVDAESPCLFTRAWSALELPVRHGEGKFVTDQRHPPATGAEESADRAALCPARRPAGQGRLSPQPQRLDGRCGRHLRPHRPRFRPHAPSRSLQPLDQPPRLDPHQGSGQTRSAPCPRDHAQGMQIFKNAVEYFAELDGLRITG